MSAIKAEEVARKANRIFPLMGRMMEARMRAGLHLLSPVHFHVLNMLEIQSWTLTALADHLAISTASMSRTISVMEERGWLTRTRSTEDRRVVTIEITDAGHQVLLDIERRSLQYLTEVFSQLSQEELQKLMDGLEILIDSFSQTLSHLPSDFDEQDTAGR